MKKLTAIILSAGIMLSSAIAVFATEVNVNYNDVLPGKSSLINQIWLKEKYAESFEDLSAVVQNTILRYGNYRLPDEGRDGSSHSITMLNGKFGEPGDEWEEHRNVICRADFTLENVECDWIDDISSDGTINIRFMNTRSIPQNPEINPYGQYLYMLCIWGDKAEQWFNGVDMQNIPASKLVIPKFSDPNRVIRSSENTGYAGYWPIVCVREGYVDRYDLSENYGDLKISIYYQDSEWLIPEKLHFSWNGLEGDASFEDMKCTSNFKGFFVSQTGKASTKAEERAERKAKWNALYDVGFYDPFSDENYVEPKKEPIKQTEEPLQEQEEKEVESEEKEAEKITETEKEPTEPEKEPEPEVKEEEKAEPEQKEEEQEQKPIPSNPDEVSVIVNGKALEFAQEPVIENNRVLVPMRKIFESLGATVEWEQAEKRVFATKGEKQIGMQIGSFVLNKGQDETVLLDAMPMLVNNHTLVPIRAVAESLDATVEWNANEKIVTIETK